MLDSVIIGAGHAGLAMGYFLREHGRAFVILERGRVGETWRTQRWDSFAVNTPNWASRLPGDDGAGSVEDGFLLRDELVTSFERYAHAFELPIEEGCTVIAVDGTGGAFTVTTESAAGRRAIETRTVVVASGILNAPKIPSLSRGVPPAVVQVHAADYRSPQELPPGAVVVVGAGQSGCQIAEDLVDSGRTVYLSASRVGRFPRRYRGRDIFEWLSAIGFWDVPVDELEDPAMRFVAQPQISGVGRFGHTVSLQSLAVKGVVLMGRLETIEDGTMIADTGLAEYIGFADGVSAVTKAEIDAYIAANGIEAPPSDHDPGDAPASLDLAEAGLTRLDLAAAGVGAVIWCTGFTAGFDWIHCPVLDAEGRPIHRRGVSD
ncbi:MAG: FAD-dependent oxidoreductase, partial [Actinobacteria bacterium]